MNLLQISTAIGQRLGTNCSDPNSRDGQAVRALVQLRHDQLWRSFLWKDSLLEYVLTIDTTAADYVPTNNYMPTKGHLILPSIVSKVLACRTSENQLNVERPMVYFRVNPDEFKLTGTPLGYYLLSACALEFDTAQNLLLQAPNPADNDVQVSLDELQADGVSVSRLVNGCSQAGAVAGLTDRIDNVIKPATQSQVFVQIVEPNLIPAGAIYSGTSEYSLSLLLKPSTTYTVLFGANETAFTNVGGQPPLVFPVVPGSIIQFTTASGITALLLVSGVVPGLPVTASIFAGTTTPKGGLTVLTLQSGDLSAPLCQRIRFMPIPAKATTLRVLGKRATPPFAADTDSPGVQGMEGILVDLGYFDFCSRDERGGTPDATDARNNAVGPEFLTPSAGQSYGKPGGFLAHLIGEEVFQAAHNSRIMPANGFGDPTYYGANETATKFWS